LAKVDKAFITDFFGSIVGKLGGDLEENLPDKVEREAL